MNLAELLRQCVMLFIILSLVTGLIYPLVITGLAQVLWPQKANGSLIKKGEAVIGSSLLGQEFTSDNYFWSRPSATSPAYNAGASSGSNLGPLNPALDKNVSDRLTALKHEGINLKGNPPVDLVTASGSGLDPHISLASARYQIPRVAKARGMTIEQLTKLIDEASELRQFGILGEPRVNVLQLNLSLDKVAVTPRPR